MQTMMTKTTELDADQQAEWMRAKSAIRGLTNVVSDELAAQLDDNVVRAENHKAQGRPYLGLLVMTETARVALLTASRSFETISEETTHE